MPLFLRKPDIGFIPTEPAAITAVLTLAQMTRTDIFYDLGCGDGRILIAAAQQFGTRGVGIEMDAERLETASANARHAGVGHLIEFRQQDLFAADFRDATVVFLYLLPHLNLRLLPSLRQQLSPGARIVSRDFDLGDWKPDRTIHLQTEEEPTFYCWVVPEEDGVAE